ncbi:MAG: hypothetical protein R2702_15130 [Acidimicrobiales bacterium]
MSVAPKMTSTSPVASAPATACSPRASIVPAPTSAPAAGSPSRTRPTGATPGTTSGSCSTRAPAPSAAPASHAE